MAFTDYNASFASVLPGMRLREDIVKDMAISSLGKGSTAAKSMIAKIELHIKDGDSFYRLRQYDSALKEFLRARALTYSVLYPGFDVGSYVGRKYIALPVSKGIENSLLDASISLVDILRPSAVEPRLILKSTPGIIPDSLKAYTKTGFREPIDIEEELQSASAQGISLLIEGKVESAIDVMEYAYSHATSGGVQADPGMVAALALNLSAAYLQARNTEKSATYASASLEGFKAAADLVGQSQALHIAGLSAQKAGDQDKAKKILTQASNLIKNASAGLDGRTVVVTPAITPIIVAQPTATPGTINPVANDKVDLQPIALRKAIGAETAVDASLLSLPTTRSDSLDPRDIANLKPIADMDLKKITFRIPGREESWGTLPFSDDLLLRQQSKAWQVGVPVGEQQVQFPISGGRLPSRSQLITQVYKPREAQVRFKDIDWLVVDTSTTAFYLTHIYSFVLPVKIGDCFHEMGQYDQAEANFLQASSYSYINKTVESTMLWIRLANNALAWGDSLYKDEDLGGAKVQYSKIITEAATTPGSFLYKSPALAVPALAAKKLIQNILVRPLPEINWDIAFSVLSASAYLQQIMLGLDYYGLALSPIHTFEYLQGVARAFAQGAIQAEREFVNFKSREEQEASTRRDLETAKAMAQAEVEGRWQQYLAALEDEAAASGAYNLAVKRQSDAITQRNTYASASNAQIWAQAAAQAQGMGQDSWYSEISELADKLARGESISGPRGKLAAAYTLWSGRKTRDYELQKMQDNIDELTKTIGIAKDQWDAAKRRTAVSEIAWQAAKQRSQMAASALVAFDNEFFTPESWSKMATVMRDIFRSYLFRAIRIAKLMERSYNFENDTELKIIKNEYGHHIANSASGLDTSLLGGDSLLKDIDSFTFIAISTKTRKSSRIKDVISLASDFPAQFEEFRRTGLLSIETDLYEFDRLHPGFYGQRVEAVEIEVIGLLPENGLHGTLTAGGVTMYRKKDGSTEKRVHQVDTMAVSDFVLRNDIFLYGTETGVRGLFQGLGVGSTWSLHLPRRSNDFDLRRIFDVRLALYYTAMFDPILRTSVLSTPPRNGEMALLRTFGLRYDFPDAWYEFYRGGSAAFNLDRALLPANQQNFSAKSVHFRVVTKPGISNQGIILRITGPNGASGTATTDSSGTISSEGSGIGALVGADPLGTWRVEVTGGEPVTDGGSLKLDRIYNVQMGLEYTFEYVPEVL